jgi:hypothetical protein
MARQRVEAILIVNDKRGAAIRRVSKALHPYFEHHETNGGAVILMRDPAENTALHLRCSLIGATA